MTSTFSVHNAETHDVQIVRRSDQREGQALVLLSVLRSRLPAHFPSDLPQVPLDDGRPAGGRVRLCIDCLLTALGGLLRRRHAYREMPFAESEKGQDSFWLLAGSP